MYVVHASVPAKNGFHFSQSNCPLSSRLLNTHQPAAARTSRNTIV